MKNTLLAAAILATLIAAPPADAQRAFTSGGHGNVECGKYLKVRADRGDVDAIVAWTWGYMTAYNQWSTYPQINQFPADHTVLAYLDKHCRDNPLDNVLQGIVELVGDVGGFRPPPRNKR